MTTNALVATKKLEELQALDNKRKAAESKKVGMTFMKDVKNSLLFQYDWADMLSAAPISMSLMGACYLAASSCDATINFGDARPEGGFKHLKYPTLKASLVQVSDTGRMAFIDAEKNMGKISLASTSLAETVNKILECINHLPDPGAALSLNSNLILLKEGSDHCYEYALAAEGAFRDWLLLVMELHQVSVYKHELTGKEEKENIGKMEAQNLSLDLTEKRAETAKDAADQLKEVLGSTKKAFEKAADKCPGPWEAIGLNMAGALAQATTTALSQALPMMMMGRAAQKPQMAQEPEEPAPKGGSLKKLKNAMKFGKYSQQQSEVLPRDFNDPAITLASSISVLTTSLYSLVTSGKGGGVNWESAASHKNQSGLTFLVTSLKDQNENTPFTERPPSTQLKAAIVGALEVLAEIQGFVDKKTTISFDELTADSPQVEKWQKKVAGIQASVLKLKTISANMPGNSTAPPPGFPMMTAAPVSQPDSTAQTAALAQATEQLKITESAYSTAQTNYAKAADNLNQVQTKLNSIRTELQQLTLANATLNDVKRILVQCMGVLVQLKEQISKLVQFFGAISALVEHVIQTSVKSFIMDANNADTIMTKLGGISLSDFQRQTIFSSSLMVRAYFVLIQSIANMYTKVSREYIFKGLDLCGELSRATLANEPHSVLQQKNKMLEDYTNSVETALRKMISETQEKTRSDLDKRVEAIAETTKYLDPPFPGAFKAIESAQTGVQKDAHLAMGNRNPALEMDTSTDFGDDEI